MNPSNESEPSQRLALRPPHIDAALQQTPLTSIVPFDPEIIPFPTTFASGNSFKILTEEEQTIARGLFRDLNALASDPEAGSSALQEPLNKIRQYLNADNLTELNFKASPLLQYSKSKNRQNDDAPRVRRKSRSKLNPLSRMVLKSTDVRYRYPTPASVESVSLQPAPEPSTRSNHEHDQLPAPVLASVANARAFEQNAAIELNQGPLLTPARSASGQKSPHEPVIIISKPNTSETKTYETFPELDNEVLADSVGNLRKRKREDDSDDAPLRINFDQQQRSDEVLNGLLDLIQDKIFVAEDHLEPDTSGILPIHASEYFTPVTAGDSDSFILKSFVQIKLHTAMQNVISNGRFQDIPSEYLSRLQKICSLTLRATDGIDLKPPGEINDDAEEAWAGRLELVNNSLLSSKCLLKIMTARPSDKELCSEELLQEVLTSLKHTLEECIIPMAEIDDASSEKEPTQVIIRQKPTLIRLLQNTGRVLTLFGDLLLLIDLSESIINTVEFFSTRLIFVETSSTEKDSILGLQRFFALRKIAMEVVAKVFFRKPHQRQGILTEILSSLEKLPGTRQSARQFKIIDKKPITLVSALIMQLIQMSSMKSVQSTAKRQVKKPSMESSDDSDSQSDASNQASQNKAHSSELQPPADDEMKSSLQQLIAYSQPLSDNAQKNAVYVAKYLIERAVNTSKSGDLPYRNLLDIFIEDFLNVLSSTDWPAAELLLRVLLSHLIGIIEADKSSAPAKTMALDLMGLMSSGIADIQNYVRRNAPALQKAESDLGIQIGQLAESVLEGKAEDGDIFTLNGPCRAVAEFLRYRDVGDLQLQGALAYYLSQWARNIWLSVENARKKLDADEEDEIVPWECQDTALWLKHMLLGQEELADLRGFHSVSNEEGRFSYAISVLNMPFCKALRRILNILLKSLSNSLPTIRNRSLISISQLVENDPGILDRADSIMGFIVPCFSDQSSLVRNSALSFIEKFLVLKPELENETCSALISISSDASAAVRKHMIKLLKGIYLRNRSIEIRSSIANTILQRLIDHEESVRDLARQTMEEIWLSPFHKAADDSNSTSQPSRELQQHAWLIVTTTQHGENVLPVLETLFTSALVESNKNSKSNHNVLKSLVSILVDGAIDNETAPGMPSQQHILQALTVFAKSEPRLFNGEQMSSLEPYIQNVSKDDNFLVYRSVIIVFRCVLPVLQSLPVTFLSSIQTTLMKSITRLGKLELNEISQCLWIIDGVLKNTERLVKLTRSLLLQIHDARSKNLTMGSDLAIKISRLITILGYFGKACNLENYLAEYRNAFAEWNDKKPSVSGLMIYVLLFFTSSKTPIEVRRTAFESICLICQSWPKNFLSQLVSEAFDEVFSNEIKELEQIILTGFKAFYDSQGQSPAGGDEEGSDVDPTGADRLGKSMTVNENDGASSGIAQKYLEQVLRIALSSTDNLALLATEIIVSTNSQGLVHPRECGPGLIALTTSPNQTIANIATQEHRSIHQKHESMLEKQYVKAIEKAYDYQRKTIGQISGVADESTTPKLKPFFDVLKSGSVQSRKKLYSNLCKQLNLDMSKRPQLSDLLLHLQYSSFVLENVSLVDYARIDELLHLISCLEKVFMSTGTTLSQNIEASLGITPASHHLAPDPEINGQVQSLPISPVDIVEFQTLTAVSMVMSMFWVTRDYLRRTWNLAKYRSGKVKLAAKDLNRAPIKHPQADPQKLVSKFIAIMAALNSAEAMEAQCRDFMEHLSVDTELKVNSEDDDLAVGGYETPSEVEENASVPPSGGSRVSKRKGSMSAASTPSKIQKKVRPHLAQRRNSIAWKEDEDDDGGWD